MTTLPNMYDPEDSEQKSAFLISLTKKFFIEKANINGGNSSSMMCDYTSPCGSMTCPMCNDTRIKNFTGAMIQEGRLEEVYIFRMYHPSQFWSMPVNIIPDNSIIMHSGYSKWLKTTNPQAGVVMSTDVLSTTIGERFTTTVVCFMGKEKTSSEIEQLQLLQTHFTFNKRIPPLGMNPELTHLKQSKDVKNNLVYLHALLAPIDGPRYNPFENEIPKNLEEQVRTKGLNFKAIDYRYYVDFFWDERIEFKSSDVRLSKYIQQGNTQT